MLPSNFEWEDVKSLSPMPASYTAYKYEAVSKEYALAVNSVLRRRKAQPEDAMDGLEKKLMRLTGLPAKPQESP